MRITQDHLRKVIRDTISRRTKSDRGLMAAYLSGSMLGDEYLLGGSGDIDLFLVHSDTFAIEREIVPLSNDIHLDISHFTHREFRHTRELRENPWLGPALNSCQILFDPQHLLDFTQASVRGQYDRSDHVITRARVLADRARQLWSSLEVNDREAGPAEIMMYLKAVENAANAIAVVTGAPLTERRFLQYFPKRSEALNRSGLYAGLMGLLGATNIDAAGISTQLDSWQTAYRAIPVDNVPIRLHPDRYYYYLRALQALLAGEQPLEVLWPLERSWTLAIVANPAGKDILDAWHRFFVRLGLMGDNFREKIEGLDTFLDTVDDTLDSWARANGTE